jgi:RHS repeat-associated protein
MDRWLQLILLALTASACAHAPEPRLVFTNSTLYLYDGMRVIQERDGNNTPLVSYTRGKDLSGSLEGAGGIGGLLARSHGYSSGNWSTHNFYHADGGGNITYLVNSSQTLSASYRYDPYGNLISSSGTLASANVYRFSSKPIHAASGLYYYGERFYEPNLQRWLNRDPMGEWGGINLYGFVGNSPPNGLDPLGLEITYYYSEGGLLYPSGSTPYLMGDNFGEQLVTSFYNIIPVAANALERFFEPLARLTEALAEGVDNAVTQVTGVPDAGDGARNLLLVGSMLTTKRCPPAAKTGVGEGTKVFRVWGDEAGAYGRSWTTVDPRTVPNYRNAAGLPNQNTGRFVSEGVIQDATGIRFKAADPLHGNAGGLPEVVIPNPAQQIRLQNVQGLNPQF